MRRISSDSQPHPTRPDAPPIVQMKVEHWQSQDAFPLRQLDWKNMLGACLGGMGAPFSDQTCDTRKGEDEILLNPLEPAHVSTLYCRSNGRLESTNPRFQEDVDERLGLNHPILVGERKARLDRAVKRLQAKYPKSAFPQSALRALADEMEAPVKLKPSKAAPGETKPTEPTWGLPELGSVLRLWARKRYRGSKW